jgi:predicted acyl esterase
MRSLAIFLCCLLVFGCSDSGSSNGDGGDTDVTVDAGGDEGGEQDGTDAGDEDELCGVERVREDIGIPTIDGHFLSAFVDRSAREDCPLPTVLLQTPYNKESAWTIFLGEERPERPLFASPHYNFVVVDWRGVHGSAGLPHPGEGAWMAQDSYDTVEWIAAQPWSDGQVGTWGVSALCGAQYRTASGPKSTDQNPEFNDGPPPHLTAMVPIMCPRRMVYDEVYPGGVLRHEWSQALDVLGYGLRLLLENNPRKNWLWDLLDVVHPVERMRVPALVISGWWDIYPQFTVSAFRDLVTESDPAVRDQHRLLIGPWIHFATGGAVAEGAIRPLTEDEWAFMDTDRRIDSDALAFFDYFMRGIDNEVPTWAKVRYHHEHLGWQTAVQWPPAGTVSKTLYLDDQSGLTENTPAAGSLDIPYDPVDPSPTIGGPTLSPYNCLDSANPTMCMLTPDPDKILLHGPAWLSELLDRSDQITFSTEALSEPLVLLGEMRLIVDIATSGADTDLAVRILDIDQDGDPWLIGEGIQRLSTREGNRAYSEVIPGQRYTVTVNVLKDFAYTIQAGHRFGIMLSASNWPLFARNPGDGAVFLQSDALPATNETFTYGVPPVEVDLKGDGQAVTNTLYLDGVTRVEFGTLP